MNTQRPNIKLTGALDEQVDLFALRLHRDITFIADPGTTLRYSANPNTILQLQDSNEQTFNYTIVDLTLLGLAGGQFAIRATGNLTLQRVRIRGCGAAAVAWGPGFNQPGQFQMSESVIADNPGGGLSLSGDFKIINSIIAGNGTVSSTFTFGGITLPSPTAPNGTLEFSTIADNLAAPASQLKAGIDCTAPITLGRNNIISNNSTATNCSLDFSLFDIGVPVTMHNKAGNPGFLDRNLNNPDGPAFYRIGSQSAALDSGDPTSSANRDIDGIARPQGAGFDMGASEFKP